MGDCAGSPSCCRARVSCPCGSTSVGTNLRGVRVHHLSAARAGWRQKTSAFARSTLASHEDGQSDSKNATTAALSCGLKPLNLSVTRFASP